MKTLALVIALLLAPGLSAQESADWRPLPAGLPDVPLVDQDGRSVRFYTDLVKGRTVVIQFVFTSCESICSPLGATFGRLQSLTDRMPDVRLVSVSVDPANDTPAAMKSFGAKFGAGPRWTLVTGAPAQVQRLLKALQAYSPDATAHSAMIWIGNDPGDRWTRAYGLSPASALARTVQGAAAPQVH